MHLEILSPGQRDLLPFIKQFSPGFYLAGGTAIALQIGHRRSIDFDLFTRKSLNKLSIRREFEKAGLAPERVLYEDSQQFDLILNSVKVTFLSYPYQINPELHLADKILLPDLLTLSAMKALALAGRGKWKDYVDLTFILRDHYSLADIAQKAKELFGEYFNKKLFIEQLCYFDDIDYSETIDYVTEPLTENFIKEFLTNIATSGFHER